LDGLASIASTLGNELKINGPRLTVSAACASGLLALIRAALLVQNGDADRALVVAVEASVHPLFIASFRRLGVLPRPGVGCRPFDNQREGFLMSDAAAAVWLERADIATPGELPPVAIERFALAEDATHLTGADPSGRVLRSVIDRCIANEPLDLIHAHGTGTQLNDAIELAALDDAAARFESPPEIYSHKGALGHSLGAAGLVSVLLSCHSHLEGLIPPNIRTHDPMPTDRLRLELKALRRPVNQSLALAAGFGGTIAAVTLRSA
jgi:3-oxoacyl-[acyl-carrier-protein] synthase II